MGDVGWLETHVAARAAQRPFGSRSFHVPGAPILAASFVLELAFALVAKAASAVQLQALLAPVRGLAVMAVFALVFDRLASVLASNVVP